MKRRPTFPLFEKTEPDLYLFDTSAWLNVESRRNCETVWALIKRRVEEGRIFTCAQVLQELHGDPIYLVRIKPLEKALLSGDSSDPAFLLRVGKITHDFPSMGKATSYKTPADPYIVALAQMENYIVVADESMKHKNRKIPGVCKQLGIRCIKLSKFIAAEAEK